MFGIERPQLLREGFDPLVAQAAGELAAQRSVGLRQVVHSFAQRLHVEARAAYRDHAVVAGEEFFEAG